MNFGEICISWKCSIKSHDLRATKVCCCCYFASNKGELMLKNAQKTTWARYVCVHVLYQKKQSAQLIYWMSAWHSVREHATRKKIPIHWRWCCESRSKWNDIQYQLHCSRVGASLSFVRKWERKLKKEHIHTYIQSSNSIWNTSLIFICSTCTLHNIPDNISSSSTLFISGFYLFVMWLLYKLFNFPFTETARGYHSKLA